MCVGVIVCVVGVFVCVCVEWICVGVCGYVCVWACLGVIGVCVYMYKCGRLCGCV
jgi:hypothetical protein